MSAPDRAAPAYQEYASDMLARRRFRLMSAAERGLLYSMRLACWVDGALPAEPPELARIVGLDLADVTAGLSAVMPFFRAGDGEIRSPELDGYREQLNARRKRQIEGGRAGAEHTNAGRGKRYARKKGVERGTPAGAGTPTSTPTPTLASPPAGSEVSRAEQSREEKSAFRGETTAEIPASADADHRAWLGEHKGAECTPEAYRRATRGA